MEEKEIGSLIRQAEEKITQRRLSPAEATTGLHLIAQCRQYQASENSVRLRECIAQLAVFFKKIDARLVPAQKETDFIRRLQEQSM